MSTPFSTLASKPPQPPSLKPTTTTDNNNNNNTNNNPPLPTTQPPSPPSRPSPFRSPSSNNYASALASALARSALPPRASPLFPPSPRSPTRPSAADTDSPAPLRTANANANATSEAATSEGGAVGNGNAGDGCGDTGFGVGRGERGEGFRPGVDRMRSWSEQDMKRAMQERLLSPKGEGEGRDVGFSSR